jgi:hypothetical protein
MRILLPLISLVLLTCATTAAAQTPLTIYLIHGLGGDKTTFCDLTQQLQDKFGKDRVRIVPLAYETQNPNKIPMDFVMEIRSQITEDYRANSLPIDAPYSLIMHSQGGIVGRNFVFHCVNGRGVNSCAGADVPKNLRHFITLGTPHWGSPFAMKASESMLIGMLSGGLTRQNKHLSIGSTTMVNDRHSFMAESEKGIRLFPEQTRVVAIAGLLSEVFQELKFPLSTALSLIAGTDKNEDDLVVPLTYANPDFYYNVENPETGAMTSGMTRISDANYMVKSRQPHIYLQHLPGLACVKEKTAEQHLGYHLILRELNDSFFENEKVSSYVSSKAQQFSDGFAKNARIFSSEVLFYMPEGEGYQRDIQLKADQIKITANKEIIESTVIRDSLAAKNVGFNNSDASAKSKHYIGFFHSGKFKNSYRLKTLSQPQLSEICYSLKIDGFEQKDFCALVSPSLATFSKVYLKPYLPIPAPGEKGTKFRMLDDNYVLSVTPSYGKFEIQAINIASNETVRRVVDPSEVPDELESLASNCFVGRVANHKGVHQGEVFAHFDDEEKQYALPAGSDLQIRGRYAIGRKNNGAASSYTQDRYFFTAIENSSGKPETFTGWVNRHDVDLLDSHPCELRRY